MSDKFINSPSTGLIEVCDVNGNTKKVPISKLKYRPSVYGILSINNEILFSWNPFIKAYSLPGGAIELGETIESALKREFKEETGLEIEIKEIIDVKENFFMIDSFFSHSILLFYRVDLIGGKVLENGNGDDSTKNEYISKQKLQIDKLSPIFRDVVLNSYH